MLIDNGSSSDLMYLTMLKKMGVRLEEITRKELPLVSFNESMTMSIGTIMLRVSLPMVIVLINFVVFDVPLPYNHLVQIMAPPVIGNALHITTNDQIPYGLKSGNSKGRSRKGLRLLQFDLQKNPNPIAIKSWVTRIPDQVGPLVQVVNKQEHSVNWEKTN